MSNIVGDSLRGVFTAVGEAAIAPTTATELSVEARLSYAGAYDALAGGTALAIGAGVIAFEGGAIWMLIPTVLGAIVAVASGLITIALRQAVVALLIMISPLAMVAMILPNTEDLFKKWKKLLTQMLVFYPMFSLLFGASQLAGFAIIASATDGFGLLLGMAVQIFPLFFSWSLMKMSGTFLGNINARMRGLAAGPLATNRAWADSHRQLSKQKHLASGRAYTPSLRLMQFLNNRKVAREEEISEYATTVKNRGLAYNVARKYNKNGTPNREAEEDYELQARNMRYAEVVERHKNNMNKGLGQLEAVKLNASAAQRARLDRLDVMNVNAADALFTEKARGEKIEYENAVGRHNRFEAAVNAHMDDENGFEKDADGNFVLDADGQRIKKKDYRLHFKNQAEYEVAANRYKALGEIMEGGELDVQFAAASAAHAYDSQAKIIMTKFQKYFELTPPTRDVRYRLEEFSRYAKQLEDGTFSGKAVDNIDAIVSGLRILNQRGDTDFLKDILDDLLDEKYGGVKLGTHASQSLASFLMFEVKDNDPYLRRFGKYINLETARMYDKNKRQKETVDYDEYVKGYHTEPDGTTMYAKRGMAKLMEGTSLDGIERTALDNYDKSLRKAYTDENGNLDLEAYEKKRKEVDTATAPQFISANLKFLSGSEQISSAVKSKTGFFAKQNAETGEYTMMPIWEDAEEAARLFSAYETPEEKAQAKGKMEKWYRDQTLQYLRDQTPAQILGLRSDYYVPLIEHLSEAYLYDDDGNEIPERIRERKALEDEVAARYGGLDSKEAKDALFAAKKGDAGQMFREVLYRKGKLGQIEKSKRSGAANNAKDWVRELLLLDSDSGLREWIVEREQADRMANGGSDNGGNGGDAGGSVAPNGSGPSGGGGGGAGGSGAPNNPINQETIRQKMAEEAARKQREKQREQLRKMLKELEEQQKREADANLTPNQQPVTAYTAGDVAELSVQIEDIWYEVRDESGDGEEYDRFFEASRDFVAGKLSEDNYVVVAYEKYYQENPNGDSYDLREHLIGLLKTLLDE